LGVRLLGEDAVFATEPTGQSRWQYLMAAMPGLAIAGGTNEILKNIIGERVLGLPPEPRLDKGVPFSNATGAPGDGAARASAAAGCRSSTSPSSPRRPDVSSPASPWRAPPPRRRPSWVSWADRTPTASSATSPPGR